MTQKSLKLRANAIGFSLLIFLFTGQILAFFVNLVFSLVSKNATLQNPIGISPWVVQAILIFISIISLVLPRLYLKHSCKLPLPEDSLKIKPVNKISLLYLGGLFVIIVTISGVFVKGVEWLLYSKIGFTNTSQIFIPDGFFPVLLAFIRACVVPAIFEELLFRDAIQGSLLPCGERFAIITTSLLFAGYHQNLGQFVGIFVLSVCLGYVAIRTKNLAVAMLLHFANNATAFLFAYATTKVDATSALAIVAIIFMLYISIAIFAVYYIKSKKIVFKPLSVIPILKNSKSRVETILTAPMFAVSVVIICCFIVSRLITG